MTEALNIDCMEYMRTLEDDAFDLAIVDPPYGISVSKMGLGVGWKGHTGMQGTINRQKKTGSIHWDEKPPTEEYFSELFRVSKNQIIWGGGTTLTFLPQGE